MKSHWLIFLFFIFPLPFIFFILWMSLTPGYFQYGPCGLRVGYYADWEIFNTQVKCPIPNQQNPYYLSRSAYFLNNFLLLMSRLDFNRGSAVLNPDENLPKERPTSTTAPTGKFCGGIAANLPQNQCPPGYKCQLEDNHPDSGGTCVKQY